MEDVSLNIDFETKRRNKLSCYAQNFKIGQCNNGKNSAERKTYYS